MALGSTQPLIEKSTRIIFWGKGGRCVRLITLPPSCAVVMKSGNLNFLEPSGPFQACNGTALPLPLMQFYILRLLLLVFRTECQTDCVWSGPVRSGPLYMSYLSHDVESEERLMFYNVSIAPLQFRHRIRGWV